MSEFLEDLLKDSSESFEDGNYFLVTITELELGKTYPLQFKWKYKDGTVGKDWSAVYNLYTPISTVPGDPELRVGDVVAYPGGIKITWSGNDASGNPLENLDRVDIHISGASFGDGTKPAGFFKTAGTQTFDVEPGIYIVQLKAIRVDGTASFFSSARIVTVPAIEEVIEAPVVPTGFSARAILGGIEVTWNGTYAGGATWSGFQAINIYAGTSTSATPGTYIKVNQMTGNKTSNKVVVPIDGTYVRYGFPAYIHASSINKATPPVESTISANVANATPSQVVNTDIIDAAITEAKIALAAITEVKIDNSAITAAKIAANAVTETKIANDAITSPKIVAGAIEAGKIAAGAITAEKIAANAIEADKIAANAITAGKIAANSITASNIVALAITGDKVAANTIDVGKLAANTISVGNLEAGDIKATSFIRAGTAGSARVEISSATVGSVLPGLTVYGSGNGGTDILLRAPLTGGLTITGSLTATQISTSSGKFNVNTSGILTAQDVDLRGIIKAESGNIGNIIIAADGIQNGATSGSSTFKLDSSGKARFGASSGNAIIIDPSAAVGSAYLYHSANGGSTASEKFTFLQSGGFRLGGSNGINYDGSTSLTIGSAGNPITINTSTGNVSIAGTLVAGSLSTTGLTIASNGAITTTSTNFGVTSGGILSATGATINGTINATGGTFSGSITASGTISGGTISGATIKTADSGSRIELNNGSYLNKLAFYTPSTFPGEIYASGGTYGVLTLKAPYSNGSPADIAMYSLGANSYIDISSTVTTFTGTIGPNSFYTGTPDSNEATANPGAYIGNSGYIVARRSGATPFFSHRTSGNGRVITFYLAGAGGGGIDATAGGTPQFAAASDYRLKENIVDYIDATSRIKAARLRKFNLKEIPGKEFVGFIAHEFAEVDPEFVTGEKDAVDEDGNPIYQSIGTTNMIYYLTGALKESIIKIEELEARLDALEG